jgi:hypothetical protein
MVATLHNPNTGEKTFCGSGMVKGPDWINGARTERDKCISALEAKGFVLDCADPPVNNSLVTGPAGHWRELSNLDSTQIPTP